MRRHFSYIFLLSLVWCGWMKAHLPKENNDQSILTSDRFSVEELVKDIFAKGTCDNISNIQSIGNSRGIGYFENGQDIIGLDKGIILSTGEIKDAKGPNDKNDHSGNFEDDSGDRDLNLMATDVIKDAVGIEFDFVPLDSFVTFRYVFASEEYCEFVGSRYNDVFGFFIEGPGINGNYSNQAKNVALIPNTDDPVAINSVNHKHNPEFYIGNERREDARSCDLGNLSTPFSEVIQYDGFTKRLVATLKLYPCQTYHIRLVVADVGDYFYDSAVFLEAGSFNIGGAVTVKSVVNSQSNSYVYEGCGDGYFLFERVEKEELSYPVNVKINVSDQSTATQGIDFMPLPTNVVIPRGQEKMELPIHTLLDEHEESLEKIIVELNIPCACYTDKAELIIKDPPPLEVDLPNVAICVDGNTELEPRVNGGIPPYSFKWDNQSTAPAISVSSNTSTSHTVTVYDACGQSQVDTSTLFITQPPTATLSGTFAICEGDTAFLDVSLIGTPPWEIIYSINDVFQESIKNIQDANFKLPILKDGLVKLEHLQDAACAGIGEGIGKVELWKIEPSIEVQPVTCIDEKDGAITINIRNGTPPFTYQWGQSDHSTSSISGLGMGIQELTIADGHGCQQTWEIEVPGPEELKGISFDCEDFLQEPLVFTAQGGTPPYQYALAGEAFMDASLFAQLEPGHTYDLWIKDASDCLIEQSFLMPINYDAIFSLPKQIEVKLGQSKIIQPQLNIPDNLLKSVLWQPGDKLSCTDCLEPIYLGKEAGKLHLTIVDKFGCREEAELMIRIDPEADIFIPNAFSPNGDNLNERFFLFANTNQVERIMQFNVFDRWGGQIYSISDVPPNDPTYGWDGSFKGKALGAGLYVYQGIVLLFDGTEKVVKGHVMLMR